jgi:putative ABC transport system ATP-binding protein
MISLKNITKTYHSGTVDTTILKGISLEIASGEFMAIMGKSGAGKSTLLYQISLLDHPTSGSIHINNTDVTLFSDLERTAYRLQNFGFVFQEYALVPELSALENTMMPLLMRGESMHHAREHAYSMLEKVGLAHRAKNRPSQLSGGEQQRVSIARAMVHSPKILFADEPTANLDSVSSQNIINLFTELHEQGQTIVMVTHEEEYTTACDRVVRMEDGVII